jgi:hypothetical protein
MKIAYLILAHRYPDQLLRLVDRLNTEQVSFLIHLDKKMDVADYQKVVVQLKNYPNVVLIERHTCYWGGFGIVEATLQGIKNAIERPIHFDYLALLSGQDYPIKTNQYIKTFLEERNGTSFIHFEPFPRSAWKAHQGGWDRIKYWHFRNHRYYLVFPRKNMLKTPALNFFWNTLVTLFPVQRKFPKGFHPYGGAQFWCLHRQHVQYIYDFTRQNPRFVRFFRYVFVPDEIFFQTIIGNLGIQEGVENDTLHFLEWERPGAILYTSDMPSLLQTSHLFARKFDCTVDAHVLDLIDEQLLKLNE